mmetsp:Transcript_42163/g.133088  ORF Transcript_42163/g.133088 Transcript_42163/m.133088 type:complete len:213 (-) Transcript_42163:68-706(-)
MLQKTCDAYFRRCSPPARMCICIATAQPVQLFLELVDARAPQTMPKGLGHQIFIDTQIPDQSFGSQVAVDVDPLVDVVVDLGGLLSCPRHDHRRTTRVAVGEFREVVNFAVDGHPAVLGNAMPVDLRQRHAPRDRGGRRLLQQRPLPLGQRRRHRGEGLALVVHLLVHLQLPLLGEGLVAVGAAEEASPRRLVAVAVRLHLALHCHRRSSAG